ncbi:MAG: hypothetical protein R3Y28_03200 [Candidatus Gastranaerophilales bacterium]
MSIKSIQPSIQKRNSLRQNNENQNQQREKNSSSVNFKGAGNPIITVMDGIDRGGFIASFMSQDFIGLVSPRIWKGLNRNKEETGEYNWDFARKEGVREILSGPSAFVIPAVILAGVKKFGGKANNVSVDFINGFSNSFADFASGNKDKLKDSKQAEKGFYENVFANTLRTSTTNPKTGVVGLGEEEIAKKSKEYAQRLIEIKNAKSKNFLKNLAGTPVEGSKEDLTTALCDDFAKLRQQHLEANNSSLVAEFKSGDEKVISTPFKKLLTSVQDFSHDALNHVDKKLAKDSGASIQDMMKNFAKQRSGTRFATNMSMFLAVVGFYSIIPKLYSLGIKGNPGLNGLDTSHKDDANTLKANDEIKVSSEEKKVEKSTAQPSFTGVQSLSAKLGDKVNDVGWLKKISDKFEFNGPAMPNTAMMTLLFGFTLPPRFKNAADDHDRKEIIVRDMTTFATILFAAKAMARGFSQAFSKMSGLALNTKPEDHTKSAWTRFRDYFSPTGGIDVMNSEQIQTKYGNIDNYKNGLNGFLEFVESNGGDSKKVLTLDKNVQENVEKLLGKKVSEFSSSKELLEKLTPIVEDVKSGKADENAKVALKKIYDVFADSGNKFIKRAKTLNSAFNFASIMVLTPMFMIWLAKYCENMTKKDLAQEALEAQQKAKSQPANNEAVAESKLTQPLMDSFLDESRKV